MADSVEIRVRVPREWHRDLLASADAQAISLSALLRLILRNFLRNKYTPEEQAAIASSSSGTGGFSVYPTGASNALPPARGRGSDV